MIRTLEDNELSLFSETTAGLRGHQKTEDESFWYDNYISRIKLNVEKKKNYKEYETFDEKIHQIFFFFK